jgi:hypothetical protein
VSVVQAREKRERGFDRPGSFLTPLWCSCGGCSTAGSSGAAGSRCAAKAAAAGALGARV